jgi:hypothetical protein
MAFVATVTAVHAHQAVIIRLLPISMVVGRSLLLQWRCCYCSVGVAVTASRHSCRRGHPIVA